MTKALLWESTAAALVLGALATAAFAQQTPADPEAESENGGTIIVTARRREERLVDVPVAFLATALTVVVASALLAMVDEASASLLGGDGEQLAAFGESLTDVEQLSVGGLLGILFGLLRDHQNRQAPRRDAPHGPAQHRSQAGRELPDAETERGVRLHHW